MANVPSIVYIGGLQTIGGIQPRTEFGTLGEYDSIALRDTLLHRVVPDDPTTGAPTATALDWFPVFDGTASDTLYAVASGTATTLTVSPDPGWTTNEWAGFKLRNSRADGIGQQNSDVTVVSNTTDTVTVSAWDATPQTASWMWFNIGRWRDTHINRAHRTATEVIGAAIPTRAGASWANTSSDGQFGVSPVPMLTRELYTHVWPVSPYFQIAHYFTHANVTGGFDDTGATERAAFLAEKLRWEAAWTALANGNTQVYEYCILDMSQNDVIGWAATPANLNLYLADLAEMIAWLRSAAVFNDSTLKVILVNHDVALNNVLTPSGTSSVNTWQNLTALLVSDVSVVNFDGLDLPLAQVQTAVPTWIPTENNAAYGAAVYARTIPRALRKRIELLEAGAAPNVDSAIPVYILIGDSLVVGTGFEAAYSTALDDATLTGTARDSRQKIWNRPTGAVEIYNAHDNSNTSGTVAAAAGPEFSLIEALMRRHPDTDVVLIKRGSGGSCLIASLAAYSAGGNGRWSKSFAGTEHYDELRTDIENAIQYVNVTLEKQAEVMGFFVGLGTNDQAVGGGGTLFANEIAAFCANLRTDFGTHTTGNATPIIWQKPQLGANSAINAESLLVRAAIELRAAVDAQFRVVDVDDLARLASDNLHLTPDATVVSGYRYEAELAFVALPNC